MVYPILYVLHMDKQITDIINIVKKQFRLTQLSIHGPSHWDRVEQIGMYLSKNTNADITVVKLFAYIHDSQRVNEFIDPGHGKRAAQFIEWLVSHNMLIVSREVLNKIMLACQSHSDPNAESEDITIQTCWDSDRLDLWRTGVTPDPKYLYTSFAKSTKTIHYSKSLFTDYSGSEIK